MFLSRTSWLALIFVAGFLTVGIPYWRLPYAAVNLPSALYTPALLVVIAGTILLTQGVRIVGGSMARRGR